MNIREISVKTRKRRKTNIKIKKKRRVSIRVIKQIKNISRKFKKEESKR